MILSPHSLHPATIRTAAQSTLVQQKLTALKAQRRALLSAKPMVAPAPGVAGTIDIPISTVSLGSSFDATIDVYLSDLTTSFPMIVDSGNTALILPSWETIAALPNSATKYQILGQGTEPWGSPGNFVKGPISLQTSTGMYTVSNCVFFACTGGPRTANFGVGLISPWSANTGFQSPGPGIAVQSPLSYDPAYPLTEFRYALANTVFTPDANPTVASGSSITLYQAPPAGYTMLDIIQGIEWMSVIPQALSIAGTLTAWPDPALTPPIIAMVDTGGTTAFLSDPSQLISTKAWPTPVACPGWTSGSVGCESVGDPITLRLGDGASSYSYQIISANLPDSANEVTLVMCRINASMRGQSGMNIGGISALFNYILIDYKNKRVGFNPRAPIPQGVLA
jgi:hypothetical protein